MPITHFFIPCRPVQAMMGRTLTGTLKFGTITWVFTQATSSSGYPRMKDSRSRLRVWDFKLKDGMLLGAVKKHDNFYHLIAEIYPRSKSFLPITPHPSGFQLHENVLLFPYNLHILFGAQVRSSPEQNSKV